LSPSFQTAFRRRTSQRVPVFPLAPRADALACSDAGLRPSYRGALPMIFAGESLPFFPQDSRTELHVRPNHNRGTDAAGKQPRRGMLDRMTRAKGGLGRRRRHQESRALEGDVEAVTLVGSGTGGLT